MMGKVTIITNRKIYFMFFLTFFYLLCCIFLGYMQISEPELLFDSLFMKIIMLIANVSLVLGFILMLGLCYSYFTKWPTYFSFNEGKIEIEYLLSKSNSTLDIKDIRAMFTFFQKHYYPWYSYFAIIEMKSGGLEALYFLPNTFIKEMRNEARGIIIKPILADEFKVYEQRIKDRRE